MPGVGLREHIRDASKPVRAENTIRKTTPNIATDCALPGVHACFAGWEGSFGRPGGESTSPLEPLGPCSSVVCTPLLR